ncbi:hypothetical protein K438DRAFT_1760407 [Mycena galopus ATCC 62051]|nr:hypothetical protein K438DRAFT_1760407 [Mycena galopus ATCC 62051]
MPRQPTVNEIRLNHIRTCLTLALSLLNELHDAFGPPFIQSIINTIQTLVNAIQIVKQNKSDCVRLMENIHGFLYAIVELHMTSEPIGSLPLLMLDNIGNFVETLHKIYTFVKAQQQGTKIKYLFRSNEMSKLLKECHAGLEQAQEVFRIQTQAQVLNDISDFKKSADLMHKELLELIEPLSDTNTMSDRSSGYLGRNDSKNSSNSFSMLPSKPKIFHGREHEMDHILRSLNQESPRIAILGGGGMGKTSLARAVLHHSDISSKFQARFFVSAEAATTSAELAALLGLHLVFLKEKDLSVDLDNLETVWEPIKSRAGIEEFLSLLTEIEHLALIITMRGAERPAKVKWSHPFLVPLQPLSTDAARQTFIEITDNSNTIEEKTEKTSVLSVGFDRQSNVEASIGLSLSSPRITSDSKELLSLLSILPNGLSEEELVESNLGIPNILSCKAALQATSLTYWDINQRLKLLVPIREYIQQILPPSISCIQLSCKYFYLLLELFMKYDGEQMKPVVNQITLNLANVHELLRQGLHLQSPTLADTICCAISVNVFYRITGHDHPPLMDDLHAPLSQLCDHQLETMFITELLCTQHYSISVSEEAMAQVMLNLDNTKDPVLSRWHLICLKGDLQRGTQFLNKALEMSQLCENKNRQIYIKQPGPISLQLPVCDTKAATRRVLDNYIALQNFFMSVGEIHLLKSEYKEARNIYCQIVETTSMEQNSDSHAFALLNIGLIDTMIGGAEENIYHNLKTAKGIFGRETVPGIICDFAQATMEHKEGKFDLAEVKFQECLSLSWGKDCQVVSFCLEQLANIWAWPVSRRQPKWAIIYLGFAWKFKQMLALHKALLFLGDVLIAHNDEGTAANVYQVALEGFTRMDVHRSRAQCMLHLGDLANKHGHISEAITLWTAARRLFERSLQTKDVTDIDSRLGTCENAHQQALIKLTLCPPLELVKDKSSGNEGKDSVD